MASNSEVRGSLSGYHYSKLGQSISCSSMETIALVYMEIDKDKLKNLKESRREDKEGFVRDIIENWACRHPENQVQVNIVCQLLTNRRHSTCSRFLQGN